MCCLLCPELTRLLFPLSELNFPALACLKWKTVKSFFLTLIFHELPNYTTLDVKLKRNIRSH